MEHEHHFITTDDGSMSAFSTQFNEHYHSTKDGALFESYHKHIAPIAKLLAGKPSVAILDICFGLGYNTLCALHYLAASHQQLRIYSPEFDAALLQKLPAQVYPSPLKEEAALLTQLVKTGHIRYKGCEIELFTGDARLYLHVLKTRHVKIDAVMQDAFSMQVNPALWTLEYFQALRALLHDDAVLTTYSTALKVRLALDACGFYLYEHHQHKMRTSTVASLRQLDANTAFVPVDMAHKRRCNPDVTPLYDD